MMKRFSSVLFLLFPVFLLLQMIGGTFFSPLAYAQSGFGVGVILGEPTGISFKLWAEKNSALDGAVSWSFTKESSFHLHADFFLHNFNIFKVEKGKLPIYYGIGGRVKLVKDTRVGVRIPIGIEYIFQNVPIDVFLEIVPLLDLIPGTEFGINGGIGIRYFFK